MEKFQTLHYRLLVRYLWKYFCFLIMTNIITLLQIHFSRFLSHTTKHSAFKDIPRFSHSTVLPFDRFLFFFNIYWLFIEVVSRSKLENRSMGLLINFRTRLFRLIHSFKSRPFFLINMLVLRVTQYQHVTVTVTRVSRNVASRFSHLKVAPQYTLYLVTWSR